VTAREALDLALREVVGPVCREAGFRGSGRTWRRRNERGDVAVVNVQASFHSSATASLCILNLAVVPEPWLDWYATVLGRPRPRSVSEAWGLWHDRLHARGGPAGVETWWEVHDRDDARRAVVDMAEQLEHDALPRLVGMLDRDELLRALAAEDPVRHRLAETVLRVDELTTAEVTQAEQQLAASLPTTSRQFVDGLAAWAASREHRS
jgi:hypothetical protein